MARLAWVTMTRGREAGFNRPPIEPRVDAGVKELTEMTYRSNRRSGEPVATSGSRSRLTVWDRIANPIWASGHGAALQAGHMTAVEPPVKISSRLLNPRGRPHMVRNPANLSDRQRKTLESLPTHHRNTARAYQIRLAFQELYEQTPEQAASFLKRWYFWATHSRLPPIIDAAHTVKRHWDGILRWFDSKIANGLIEGINSLVQAAKAKARGCRAIQNLKAMVDLLAGKLDLRLPA